MDFLARFLGNLGRNTALMVAAAALWAAPAMARGQIFVGDANNGTIGEYTTSGGTVNAMLVSGIGLPAGLAVSGSDLFVTSSTSGTIGQYTTSGTIVNAALVSGLNGPDGIAVTASGVYVANYSGGSIGIYAGVEASTNPSLISGLGAHNAAGITVSGPDIFETNPTAGTVGEYNLSGGTVNAALLSLNMPTAIAMSGSDLLVSYYNLPTLTFNVGEYTTTGVTINSTLITGLKNPTGIAVLDSDIFVANYTTGGPGNNGGVAEYTTSGTLVNAMLIPDNGAYSIAVESVPEPASPGVLVLVGAGLLMRRGRRGELLPP